MKDREKKILELVDSYWKFDKDQQPISSWHDKQDLLTELEKLLLPSKEFLGIPEWFTPELIALAKQTWNDHKITDDGKRVEAIRIIQRGALAAGYTIGIKKSMELLQLCL